MIDPVIIGNATLYNSDCMEYLSTLPDNAFDLAVCDPPYGIKQDGYRENNRSKLATSKNYHKALWSQKPPSPEYFTELRRVSRNQIIWGGNHLADLIGKKSPCWLVWKKFTTGNFADCELAYTSFDTAVRLFEYPWNGMIQGFHGSKSKNEERIHPTQKPIALYEWIYANYAQPSQRILDTHMGSGSSVIAALNIGFEIVACELEQVHFTDAIERISRSQQQERLFA